MFKSLTYKLWSKFRYLYSLQQEVLKDRKLRTTVAWCRAYNSRA